MKVKIREMFHACHMDVIGGLSKKDFKEHCLALESKIFTQLPKKERNDKINEIYGELHPNAKPVSKTES